MQKLIKSQSQKWRRCKFSDLCYCNEFLFSRCVIVVADSGRFWCEEEAN